MSPTYYSYCSFLENMNRFKCIKVTPLPILPCSNVDIMTEITDGLPLPRLTLDLPLSSCLPRTVFAHLIFCTQGQACMCLPVIGLHVYDLRKHTGGKFLSRKYS